MSYQFPASLNKLIDALTALPGLGPKAAQRMAFYLLADQTDKAAVLSAALREAKAAIHLCPQCGNYTDKEICSVCADSTRDHSLLCVVEGVADIISMERSRSYNGIYHVLGGVISPMEGIGPDKLNLAPLGKRLRSGKLREVVLATGSTIEGEATARYLAQKIKPMGITVSRIAHGMPVGGTLAYADEATLSLAINDRKLL